MGRTRGHAIAPDNCRIIECGTFTEYRYTLEGLEEGNCGGHSEPRKWEDLSFREKWDSAHRRQSYYREQAYAFERLMDTNLRPHDKFLTLTMADKCWTVERLPEAKREWEKFVKRLRRYHGEKYENAVVWELQERGVVHFHGVFFGMPYTPAADLEALWGLGFVRIKDISDLDYPARYLAKYFSKGFGDEDAADLFDGRPRKSWAWSVSRGVRRPVERREHLTYPEAVALMERRIGGQLRQYRDLAGREIAAWRVPTIAAQEPEAA